MAAFATPVLVTLLAASLMACSTVQVRSVDPNRAAVLERTGARTTAVGARANETLLQVGVDPEACIARPDPCLAVLAASRAASIEARLAASAELQLAVARALDGARDEGASLMAALDRYVDAAHFAYAYLFFSTRTHGEHAEEAVAVRQHYNYATERFTQLAFEHGPQSDDSLSRAELALRKWRVRLESVHVRLPRGQERPQELVPASHLRFDGIRNVYRRDGLGATFVAVAPPDSGASRRRASSAAADSTQRPIESGFLATTVVMSFPGATLDEVLAARTASVEVHDPILTESLRIGELDVPLAANFTAPYALWLARSDFQREAGAALIRSRAALDSPRVYLVQPYDPNRRTIVMLHGLGSSPEAWVNVVNEVLGDAELRRRYQIWQVFYPTSLPLPENRKTIRTALLSTFAELDPDNTAPASRNVTLIGHSMGGVLARLLLIESDTALWDDLFRKPLDAERRARLAELEPYLTLEPLRQVDTAIFLAAPHRGSPLAAKWRGRLASHFMRMPFGVVKTVARLTAMIREEAPLQAAALSERRTSIDNLNDRDRYLLLTAELPIVPGVTYHSIMGRRDPDLPTADSTDGVVPYGSAHLEGAASELVVTSGHHVQDSPEAILEVQRILREREES